MFSAAIKLRYSQPNKHRSYKIPGGNFGMWIVAGSGLICCLLTILVGFVPPTQIKIDNIVFFETFLISGMILFVLLPFVLFSVRLRITIYYQDRECEKDVKCLKKTVPL
jgi:Na+/melibiose symporter-like transporter